MHRKPHLVIGMVDIMVGEVVDVMSMKSTKNMSMAGMMMIK
jgi:hypothetical protein